MYELKLIDVGGSEGRACQASYPQESRELGFEIELQKVGLTWRKFAWHGTD